MLKQGIKGKSMKVILAGSLIGLGAFTYLPDANAEETNIKEEANAQNILSKLEIEGVSLNQDFAEDVHDYRATIENDIEKITFHVESPSKDAVISVNGTKLTNGVVKDLLLQTGMNTFEITVSDGTNEAATYTVVIEKPGSGENRLTSIGLSQGSLAFDPNVSSYHVSVENQVKSVTVTPSLSDRKAHVIVDENDATKGGVMVPLQVGETAVKINVTAENGDERTYTLTITRADAKKQETDVSHQDKGQKQPAIKKPSSAEENKPNTPSTADSINDIKPTKASQAVKEAKLDNISSEKVNPGIDQVSAAGQSEEKEEAPVLNSLKVSTGVWNKSFASNEHTYHIEVDNDVTEVDLHAAAGEDGVTIEYEGESGATVKLKNKAKTAISVTVSKEGKRRTYVLVFEKDLKVEMDDD
ncbi:cadherin-like beta sandwich domain-containing protein [Peribacillus sp. SI8-4]|uniref:cadherin-like beta sandwich domain-containing protein n=1 Tax=Peribacillus sp. SI8-4 TaxID=3048009 RepID=UPI0025565EBC|nr:cadherin-like beta sandwich domain-containing protein [Peribacillus sp. SI8-4]